MRKVYNLLFILLFFLFNTGMIRAEEYKILVLPDNIQFDSTNYLIYPDSSVIFASDVINEIKKSGKVDIVSMTEVRDALRKNPRLYILTKKALSEFKYNYNISFVDFKAMSKYFGTNKILIITSQIDVQNHFLKRTLWDFLNIPGATVIDPAYKLSTYVALIDVDKEFVIWQNTYYKKINSMENRIIAQNFAPATEQLEKIKFYSLYFLSPIISSSVQARILPSLIPIPSNIVEVTDQKPLDTTIPVPEEINFKPKMSTPLKIKQNGYGAIINDL